MPIVPPVVFVPGIIATNLRDEYPVSPETIWSPVLHKNYARLALHPDNPFRFSSEVAYETLEPARVRADKVFDIAYDNIIEELRDGLGDADDRPVPVYPFPYDWRQPLDHTVGELKAFVNEVIARTLLMRHYHLDSGYRRNPTVILVGHSMGGLVITGYLQQSAQGQARVSKVVTLATPFQGSFESVVKIATGTANLGTKPPSPRERKTARLMPSLYHLLPKLMDGLFVDNQFIEDDPYVLFRREYWQRSVLDSIAEFIRLHGRDADSVAEQATGLFDKMLGMARAYREKLDSFTLEHASLTPLDWLCVVGVNADTRVTLEIRVAEGSPNFIFRSRQRMNLWASGKNANERKMTGDGTVHFAGALPTFLDPGSIVCITPDDFGPWEWIDRGLVKLSGFHGIIPNMDMVQRLVVRFLTGRADRHGNTWGRRAPGVEIWNPPIPDLKEEGDGKGGDEGGAILRQV